MFGLFSKKQKPKTALDSYIFKMYGNPPPPAGRANLDEAVNLAFNDLFSGQIEIELVRDHATKLHTGQIPYTTHDLALSTAIYFYKEVKYMSKLEAVQIFARLEALQWFKNGLLHKEILRVFENDLYKIYKR
jgi:hypothetical protein